MKELMFSVFPSENFVDLGLYQFGYEQCEPAHSFGPAVRNHFLFHYIISGTGILMANDSHGVTQTYHVKSGQGFMIFPGQINTYISDEKLPWEYTWIEFDGLRAKETIELSGLSLDNPIYKATSKDLREILKEELLYIASHGDATPFHLIGHLYLAIDALIRSTSIMQTSKISRLQDFYIHEALSYIEQNFQNDISVENIAAVCGLNRSYFGKIFKDGIGKSPQEFLLNYRMIKAAELLKLTKLSIKDVGNAINKGIQKVCETGKKVVKTAVDWVDEHKTELGVIAGAIGVSAITVLTFGAGGIVTAAVVGASVGVSATATVDIVRGETSSIETYIGSAFGGALGGILGAPSAIGKVGTTIGASEKILNFLSKPFIIGGISSGTSTLVGESLETMTGTNKRGIEQIGLDVLEDLILGGILGGIGSKIKIKGLNAGRNNYQAIFAGGITRLVNGTGAMHLKTLLKGYIAQLVESIRDGVAGEIYDYIKTELFGCGEA